jgi:uncharacterized protein (DUF927 family)
MLEHNTHVVYLKPESFQRKHVEMLRGIVDITLGITLVYTGSFEDKWMTIRDCFIKYALEHKDILVEQWDMLRHSHENQKT